VGKTKFVGKSRRRVWFPLLALIKCQFTQTR